MSTSSGAYDDPKANIVIADGKDFVANCTDKFDVIISDSTDPIGPGKAAGRWSIRVNGNWRITFEFRDGNAYILDYEDYH
ncbi:MAG: type II toxin-antitoxin system RelE/ParE family toxin [Pseudomonadota bacterium]|nr:type II toxin-antitoxin system RelE/ParE family toxin [Pseudomonadota bacterium]MEC8104051.1 type II toxin-antitoxin system RelE/ParE family toxin [Pseudomonadota bacterium]MEC8522907.1 type II toxin-antitoxin system RelE/ParE family toxin [Pseudomonadota bacterium]